MGQKTGKKNSKGGAKDITLKTSINFAAMTEKKKTHWGIVAPALILIVVLAALFSKFGVIERFNQLEAAQNNVRSLEEELETDREILSSSDELTETFYHYTHSDMTEEELENIDRVKVLELSEFLSGFGAEVSAFRITTDSVDVTIGTDSLDSVSMLSRELGKQEIVDTVSVLSIVKPEGKENVSEDGDTTYEDATVTAQFQIHLKTKSALEEEKGEE